MSRNLWGDFPVEEDVKTPESVLRDQAQILAEATQGLLDGRLEFSQKGSDFDIRFYIVAPLLNNFRYLVARVVYPATLFPVEVWGGGRIAGIHLQGHGRIRGSHRQDSAVRKYPPSLFSAAGPIP